MIVGGVYYLGRQTAPKPSPSPVVSQTSQPTPSPVDKTANPDSIGANWKTYTNAKYKIEFKYPANFLVKESIGGQGSILYADITRGEVMYRVEVGSGDSGWFEHFKSNQTINVNGADWAVVPESSYCDAGDCGPTASGYYWKGKNSYVALSLFGDDSSQEIAKKILQTIKVLK